jgi:serine protease Do
VTGPLRRALRLASDRGALVQDVTAATPGERAGLRPYDVIAGVDAQPVRTDEDLIRYVSSRMPGTIVELDVYRDGVARTVPIKLTERPGLDGGRPRGPRERSLRPVSSREYGPFGVTVRDLDQAMIQRNRIPDGVQGVMVSYVDPAGAGRLARLRTGQVIMEINRRRVTSAADFRAVTAALEPGAAVAALIYDPAVDGRLIVTVHLDGTR